MALNTDSERPANLAAGWCNTCMAEVPKAQVVGVQYQGGSPEAYDGVSEWLHPPCGRREGRWTGKRLRGDDVEPRFGGK